MSRRFLSEHDHDVYLIECLEAAALERARLRGCRAVDAALEGYDADLDDANGWVGAEERERVVRGGEQ